MAQTTDKINTAILANQIERMGLVEALGPYGDRVKLGYITSNADEPNIVDKLKDSDVALVSETFGGIEKALLIVSEIKKSTDMGIVAFTHLAPSNNPDTDYRRRASSFITNGANSYVSIGSGSLDHLIEAMFSAKIGYMHLPNMQELLEKQQNMIIDALLKQELVGERLTFQERNVLELFLQGHGNPEIARILGVESRTVDSHMREIYDKLGIQGGPNRGRALYGKVLHIANGISVVERGGYVPVLFAITKTKTPQESQTKDIYAGFEHRPNEAYVKVDGREIILGQLENKLLRYLHDNPDVRLSRNEISQGAWEGSRRSKSFFSHRMTGLMDKIQPSVYGPQFILHLGRGVYRFSTKTSSIFPPKLSSYDPDSGTLDIGDTQIGLNGHPKDIVDILYPNLNKPVTSEDIIKAVWGPGHDISVLKSAMSILKGKLTVNPMQPYSLVKTQENSYMLMG